jgi:hypothetical protein
MTITNEISNFIGGARAAAQEGRTSDLIDPSTGEVFASAPVSGQADLDAAFGRPPRASRSGATPRRATASARCCGSPTRSRSGPTSSSRSSRRTPASRAS